MKTLKVTPDIEREIRFNNNDFGSMSMSFNDAIIIQDAETYDKGYQTLIINWNFMSFRFWNLSDRAQELIMDKLDVDRIEN